MFQVVRYAVPSTLSLFPPLRSHPPPLFVCPVPLDVSFAPALEDRTVSLLDFTPLRFRYGVVLLLGGTSVLPSVSHTAPPPRVAVTPASMMAVSPAACTTHLARRVQCTYTA